MRYKQYILTGNYIGCGSTVFVRHRNDFAHAKDPNNLVLKRATEIKDGVWFTGSDSGDMFIISSLLFKYLFSLKL